MNGYLYYQDTITEEGITLMIDTTMIHSQLADYGHYGPLHGDGLINHLPMAQIALWKMGATEEHIKNYSQNYLDQWKIRPTPVLSQKILKLEDALGKEDYYSSYVMYFKHKIRTDGIEKTLKESLDILSKGMASGLFHGLIRIAYGLEADSVDEICRGLALYAVIYHETIFAEKTVESKELPAALFSYHQNDDAHFYMSGTIEEKEVALAETLSQMYLSTGNFIVLHTITGFHALMVLKHHYSDFDDVLNRYTVCVQRAIRRLPKQIYIKIALTDALHDWDRLHEKAIESTDAHTIKFVYTCHELNKLFESRVYLTNANIKLQHG